MFHLKYMQLETGSSSEVFERFSPFSHKEQFMISYLLLNDHTALSK